MEIREGISSPEPLVKLSNVSKIYPPDVQVLEDISMDILPGEFVGIVGPAGCGKTVLLRIIAGFEQPTHGQVMFKDKPIVGPGISRCMIFQDILIYPHLSVLENTTFGLEASGIPKKEREEKAMQWLEMMGLGKFSDKYPHELSGGMQQRVGIARVMVNEPAVLLCDEPFGNLDWITREGLCDELLRIWHRMKNTVIYASAAIEEVVYLSQRIYILPRISGSVVDVVKIDLPDKRWEEKGLRYHEKLVRYVDKITRKIHEIS